MDDSNTAASLKGHSQGADSQKLNSWNTLFNVQAAGQVGESLPHPPLLLCKLREGLVSFRDFLGFVSCLPPET